MTHFQKDRPYLDVDFVDLSNGNLLTFDLNTVSFGSPDPKVAIHTALSRLKRKAA